MARAGSSGSAQNGAAVVGKGANIRGRVTGDGDLRVEGSISGDVNLKGELTVADGAEVTADVQATSVVVEGSLEGDIGAGEAVAIRSSATVSGTIRGARIT